MRLRTIVLSCLCLLSISSLGQKTIVTGEVRDVDSDEALPFVNIYFSNSKIGTTTDEKGYYRLETYYPTDSLVASIIGYAPVAQAVIKDKSQVIDFELDATGIALGEVTIVGDKREKDPALEIIKKVVRNKKANNREKLDAYEYDVYNKIEFDMNNIDPAMREARLMRSFDFVFDNIDSTSEDKVFLPIFLTESISRYYYLRDPKRKKEEIKASKVAGVKNESVSQLMGDMYQSTNVYDNYVEAFGKNFLSPIADFGTLSYKYYLLDSAHIDGYKCYQIAFKPRRKGELVFEGEMWVHDTTFAIKEIEVSVREDVNINWVHSFKVHHVYEQVEPEVWMLTREEVIADFNILDNSVGFYGRKSTIYSNFMINKPRSADFFNRFDNIAIADSANDKNEDYWKKKRPEPLSTKELNVYSMADSIQEVPLFKGTVDAITLFATGYWEVKYVDIGPYFTFFSFNQIEGIRLRFGGKTNSDFSTKIELSGYAAYGLKDEQWKYQGASRLFLSDHPRQIIHLSHRRDLEQLGQSSNAWRTDNILSSVFRRNPNNQLNAFEEYLVGYEIEYAPGISNTLTFNRRDIWSVGAIPFERYNSEGNLQNVNRINTTEIRLATRIAIGEKFISGNLDRISLGTDKPIFKAEASFGIAGWLGGEYEYQRLGLQIQDRIPLSPLGRSDITIGMGKIWGTLPFPLLNLFSGNETYFYDPFSFNLMNFYEFAGDEWATLLWVHHFDGLLFNRLPLIRRLKWREVASLRGAVGRLSNKHQNELAFPDRLYSLNRPYFEAGVGVENILKFFRVDALWRLSYLNNPDVVPFGIRVTYQVEF